VLGNLGEDLVAKVLNCTLSSDQFDSVKDMVDPDGRNIEVKTQNRYAARDVFSIRRDKETNLNKCMTVDRLLVVEYDASPELKIWEVTDRNDFQDYTTRPYGRNPRGLDMRGWNINSMNLLHKEFDDELARSMRELSSSATFSPTGKHFKPSYRGYRGYA
jgi:hypothetical protein